MNGLIVGVYGLYLILVGVNGNAGDLAGKVQNDAPKFLPWVIAIFVLVFLRSSSETGRKVTGPFLALLILTFVLKRFPTLKDQTLQLWNMAANFKPAASTIAGDKAAQQVSGPAAGSPTVGQSLTDAMNRLGINGGNLLTNSGASDALFALEHSL